ncbi:glycoside hydrolase [Dacryopinax primogenitus]|uniref:Glycoside hydrolase n=1 Tax=Dacryopinax primogenitus (strain DJM 731) TaxID=1858805 RepID=M5FR30_DACPD|nr:glycoside hydrolase [Dacryopinax primogenitus]EJT99505.1 glycoside hydrolase [Dacryopinax primogenitus]
MCGGGYRLNLYSYNGPTPNPKLVIAHHIVGNTYPYQQSDWDKDIALAQANGIDGFALNYGRDSWQPSRLADCYAAAVGHPGFKLFLSADMSSLSGSSGNDATTLANQVKQFANHPNQLSYNDGVVLSTFSGENSYFGQGSVNAGWQSVISQVGTAVTFIPAWFVDPSTFGNYPVLNGAFNWNGGWPMSNSDTDFSSDQQWINGLNGKLYMAPVTPNFFTHYSPQTYNKNWIYRNDDNLYPNRWELLISNRNQIALAEIISWNDYGESHYIGPIEGAQPNSQAWVNGFPHTAWLDMTGYYAQAFKSGVYPSITKDKMYIYARPHPKDAQACCDSVSRPSNWQNTDDAFYVVVFATSPGTLILGTPPTPSSTSPTASAANPSTAAVTSGVNKYKLALTPGNGMRATLMRGTNQVLDLWPQDYVFNPSPSVYNFNAYVNMAST